MRARIIYQLLGLALIALSCQEQDSTDNKIIKIGQALSSPTELKASDYFSEIHYVQLETSDSCLIGSVPDLRVLGNNLLITTAQKQCLLFDKATGKFKAKIGHVANDPGGYSNVNCILDESKDRLLFYGWDHDLICYDLEGNYIGKVAIPSESDSYPQNCFYLGGDTIIGYYENMIGNETKRMIYFKENGESIALLANERICQAFEIKSMSVWKGEEAMKEFGASAQRGLIYMEGVDAETANVLYPNNPPFWNTGEETYLKEFFNDTIFRIDGTSLIPYLTFDNAELGWEYKDRFRKDKSTGIFISQVLDSEHTLYCLAVTNLYNKDKRKSNHVMFDKKSGVTKVAPLEKGITDDLNGFLPLKPLTVSLTGEYGGLLMPDEIVSWFNKHPEKVNSQVLKSLSNISEEQNPVVVLAH